MHGVAVAVGRVVKRADGVVLGVAQVGVYLRFSRSGGEAFRGAANGTAVWLLQLECGVERP